LKKSLFFETIQRDVSLLQNLLNPVWIVNQGGFPTDDLDDLVRYSRPIREAIHAGMKDVQPKRGIHTVKTACPPELFNRLFSANIERKSSKLRFMTMSYHHDSSIPTHKDEWQALSMALNISQAAAYRLLSDAKKSKKPIPIESAGDVVKRHLASLQSKLEANANMERFRFVAAEFAREVHTLSKVSLSLPQIQQLEQAIGPFMAKKKPKNHFATHFIEARRIGDPEHILETPTFDLSFDPATAILTIKFTYIIRSEAGIAL